MMTAGLFLVKSRWYEMPRLLDFTYFGELANASSIALAISSGVTSLT